MPGALEPNDTARPINTVLTAEISDPRVERRANALDVNLKTTVQPSDEDPLFESTAGTPPVLNPNASCPPQ